MPLVAVCSVKGRPGVTTVAVGLATVASAEARAVVVEVDPAGGDLAARHRLSVSPGLVELATAARRIPASQVAAGAGEALSGCARWLRLGERSVEVVVGPFGGVQSRVALSVLARTDHPVLAPPDRLVVADCGRVDFGSPVWPLLSAADAVLVLVAGRVEDVEHLRAHLDELYRVGGDRLAVVLAPGGRYQADEVASALTTSHGVSVPVVAALPADPRGAGVLAGELLAGSRWRRLPLFTALDQLMGVLQPRLLPSTVTDVAYRREQVR